MKYTHFFYSFVFFVLGILVFPGEVSAAQVTTVERITIASEGSAFSYNGAKVVRYGTGSQYMERTVSRGGRCSNGFFGKDPAPYRVKSCSILNTVTKNVTSTKDTKTKKSSKRAPSKPKRTLIIEKRGLGTVSASPGEMECGIDCKKDFRKGKDVLLTAVPSPGYVFDHWADERCASQTVCEISLDRSLRVQAIFTPILVQGDQQAPSVTFADLSDGATVSGITTLLVTVSDDIGVSGVQFKLDGLSLGLEDIFAPFSMVWNTNLAANGTHTLTAIASDAASNSASASITVTVANVALDSTPPVVSLTAPTNGVTVSGSTSVVSASASDNVAVAGVQFKLDGSNLGSEDTTSPYSVTWDTTTAANGSHSITAVARDAAGNSTTSSARTVTVSNAAPDTTAPVIAQVTAVTTPTTDTTPDYVFSSTEAGTLSVGGSCASATTSVSSGNTTLTFSALAAGTYANCTLQVTDSASNASNVLNIPSFTIDTTAPTVSLTAPDNAATITGATVAVTASASDNIGVAGVQFQYNGLNLGGEDTSAPYSITWNTTNSTNGVYILTAIARDSAGNTTTSSSITVTVSNAVTADSWPATTPDMLNVDLVDLSTLRNAKYLDGSAGWDGQGTALHYGDMSGGFPNGDLSDFSGKLSNATCPPQWGVEANGLHYLESCTDGAQHQTVCDTCRIINWQYKRFSYRELYYRVMVYAYQETLDNMNELGIKLSGPGGSLDNNGTFAEIFELGQKTSTGWPLQAYRYDAEVTQGVTIFPNFEFQPGRWYTIEGHLKVPTTSSSNDGIMEYKVDGEMLYARTNVNMGASAISTFYVQWYHGGVQHPNGILRVKTARIALCRTTWCGPAPEVAGGGVGGNSDTAAPTVSLTAPSNSATVTGSATTVSASASDNIGVSGVQFKLDGSNLGTEDTVAPYSITWDTTTAVNGSHTLTAVARDAAGNSTTSSSVSVTVSNAVQTNYPAWRQNLTANTFSPIANTSSMNGVTNNSGTINAWNGLAASTNTIYTALNGGHADSSENKVIKLDLSTDAPSWTLVHAGSAGPGAADQEYYPDGLPASRHTYYTLHYIAQQNRLMTFGSYALYGTGGGGGTAVDGFNLGNSTWDPAGTWARTPFNYPVMSEAKDPRTGDVYIAGNYQFSKWTQATNTWQTFGPAGINNWFWPFKGSFIDVVRNKWVMLNGSIYTIDLNDRSAAQHVITGPASVGSSGNFQDYSTTVHDVDNDRYITVKGTTVYAINPDTYDSTVITTVPAPTNGMNNRLVYLSDLGGVAYLPSFTSNMLFLPTR